MSEYASLFEPTALKRKGAQPSLCVQEALNGQWAAISVVVSLYMAYLISWANNRRLVLNEMQPKVYREMYL